MTEPHRAAQDHCQTPENPTLNALLRALARNSFFAKVGSDRAYGRDAYDDGSWSDLSARASKKKASSSKVSKPAGKPATKSKSPKSGNKTKKAKPAGKAATAGASGSSNAQAFSGMLDQYNQLQQQTMAENMEVSASNLPRGLWF